MSALSSSPVSQKRNPPIWRGALIFAVLSPLTAVPICFVLMLAFGDSVFGSQSVAPGLVPALLEALRRALAAIFITLIYVGEHILVLGPLLVGASLGYAGLTRRVATFRYRLVAAMIVSGVLYPGIFLLAEWLDWDAGLFN